MPQIQRILELNAILVGRRTAIRRTELQQRLGCSRATLTRDLARLRDDWRTPVVYDREFDGYRIDPGQTVGTVQAPGVWFSPAEITALVGCCELLRSAQAGPLEELLAPVRKSVEGLLSDRRIGMPDWAQRIRMLRMAARSDVPCFRLVADALARRHRLGIVYRARSTSQSTQREVSPQRLTYYRDNWYLDAYCHSANALRTFALDRIDTAHVLAEPAREVAEAELESVLATSYGIFAGRPTEVAELEFTASAARWVGDEQWHPQQKARRLPDGRLQLSIPYSRPEELIMDIMRHGPEVVVRKPAALRREVARRLKDAAARYVREGE